MDAVSMLWAVFLVCSSVIQGSSAVTPLFVLKGQDVLLNVTKADALQRDFDVFLWKHNEKDVIVRLYLNKKPKLSDNYTERIEISQKNYSVKLKNLQESDSGVYTARVVGATEEQIAEHRITVQDPVTPVKLTVDSVSNSSDSCNLDVTCSTLDNRISSSFRCDAQNCSLQWGSEDTTSGASLHVYLENDSIICDNSNKVSRTKKVMDIQHLCPQLADEEDNNITVLLIVCFAVLISLAAAVFCHRRRRYRRVTIENTIYDVARARPTAQRPPDDTSDLSPASIYSLAGSHTGSTQTRGQTLPDSLYAQVHQPARS